MLRDMFSFWLGAYPPVKRDTWKRRRSYVHVEGPVHFLVALSRKRCARVRIDFRRTGNGCLILQKRSGREAFEVRRKEKSNEEGATYQSLENWGGVGDCPAGRAGQRGARREIQLYARDGFFEIPHLQVGY